MINDREWVTQFFDPNAEAFAAVMGTCQTPTPQQLEAVRGAVTRGLVRGLQGARNWHDWLQEHGYLDVA